MANADKCYLHIPYKEFANILERALANVEGVDHAAIRTLADQEFDNYKEIERRINDPDCTGGGCCSDPFSGSGTGSNITSGNSGTVTFSSGGTGDIAPASFTSQLSAGMWMVSGWVQGDPASTATGGLSAEVSISPGTTQGGHVSGLAYYTAHTQNASVFFGGLMIRNAAWTPTITITNNLGVTLENINGVFSAARFCDPCDYNINPGGG